MENSDIKFSVLMSVYEKETLEHIKECISSLLKQTIKADEWIMIKDGPLSKEVEDYLDDFNKRHDNIIKFVVFKENKGLGVALNAGVKACNNELIARMDTDDISLCHRFEHQINEFKNNNNLDIVGGVIEEFEGNVTNIISRRVVPFTHRDIVKYQKKRTAFNHMTVMFKKSSVLRAGNYLDCPLMEDAYLWARMLQTGSVALNLNETLVYARIGTDMVKRRGGFSYYKNYKNGRKKIYETGFITKRQYKRTVRIMFIFALIPTWVRKLVFKQLLREV